MVLEIAQIEILEGHAAAFEAAVASAKDAFAAAKGFKGLELHRSVEFPARYRLFVYWETIENHTVDFRGSENFAVWRTLASPHFAGAPVVEHVERCV
jgi:heme-degrading monooxygenase HmoA